jgi:hypothetical protein
MVNEFVHFKGEEPEAGRSTQTGHRVGATFRRFFSMLGSQAASVDVPFCVPVKYVGFRLKHNFGRDLLGATRKKERKKVSRSVRRMGGAENKEVGKSNK